MWPVDNRYQPVTQRISPKLFADVVIAVKCILESEIEFQSIDRITVADVISPEFSLCNISEASALRVHPQSRIHQKLSVFETVFGANCVVAVGNIPRRVVLESVRKLMRHEVFHISLARNENLAEKISHSVPFVKVHTKSCRL